VSLRDIIAMKTVIFTHAAAKDLDALSAEGRSQV